MPPINSPKSNTITRHSFQRQSSPQDSLSYLESVTAQCSTRTIQTVAGAGAGIASSIVTCPLDVIKTSLQWKGGHQLQSPDSASIQHPYQDRGLIGTARLIWRRRGLRGLYRGLGPTISAYLPRWAVYFSVYHGCQDILENEYGVSSTSSAFVPMANLNKVFNRHGHLHVCQQYLLVFAAQ